MRAPTDMPRRRTATGVSGGDAFGAIALGFVLTLLLALYEGLVLSIAWTWFLVPYGLPPLPVLTAAAIDFMIGIVIPKYGARADEASRTEGLAAATFNAAMASVLITTACLACLWLIHIVQG